MVTFEFLDGLDVESMRIHQYYLLEITAKEDSERTDLIGVLQYLGQTTEGCCVFTPFEVAPGDKPMMDEEFYEDFLESKTDHLKVTVVSLMGRVGCHKPCEPLSDDEMMFGVESPGGN